MDLSTQSLPELRRLLSRIEAEIRRRNDTTRRNLLKRMQKMASDEGLTLEDILPASARASTAGTQAAGEKKTVRKPAAKKPKSAPVIKYRNPANPEQGWTGHGRRPNWALEWVAQGKDLQDLAV